MDQRCLKLLLIISATSLCAYSHLDYHGFPSIDRHRCHSVVHNLNTHLTCYACDGQPISTGNNTQISSSYVSSNLANVIEDAPLVIASAKSSGIGMFVYTSSLVKTKIDRIATQQPECHLSCGGVTILYPFGIGKGCFRDGFEITCELSNTTHKNYVPILAGTNLQVLNISLAVAEVQVQPLNGWQCYNQSGVQAYYSAEADLNPKSVYR